MCSAETNQIGDLYYNLDTEDQTAEVTYEKQASQDNYSGLTSVTIPVSVAYEAKTYSVIRIGNESFRYCSGLDFLDFPAGCFLPFNSELAQAVRWHSLASRASCATFLLLSAGVAVCLSDFSSKFR